MPTPRRFNRADAVAIASHAPRSLLELFEEVCGHTPDSPIGRGCTISRRPCNLTR
jgi:hypothetical protein